jgi:Secretion system C-terminal sorting domain
MLMLLSFQIASAQVKHESKCQEPTIEFRGIPKPTLCEKIPPDEFAIQIGEGTAYPKSSSLGPWFSGNAYMIGNFEVDAPFEFKNALVHIAPKVKITVKGSPNGYDPGSSLIINNSKLYCCKGLWRGITLEYLSSIFTHNETEIEDAAKAIYAGEYCSLSIENTTFNRNFIGIELETLAPNAWNPGPVVWVFRNNKFTCTAPLNGGNLITEAGVKLKNASLYPLANNNSNTFQRITNGIVAKSSGSNLFASCNVFARGYHFDQVLHRGIDFTGNSLIVSSSRFTDIGDTGILFDTSTYLNLHGNLFTMAASTVGVSSRVMVEAFDPIDGNTLEISGNNFSTTGTMSSTSMSGIRLISTQYSTFETYIRENVFNFQNTGIVGLITDFQSQAVEVLGFLSGNSDIDIELNTFNHYALDITKNISVKIETGTVNLVGNTFRGAGLHVFANGGINANFSILDNTINPAANFNAGIDILDAPNTTICSNTNNGASNVGYILRGQNPGMIFSGNHSFGCWQHTLWIVGNQPVIGQQLHYGNEWGPAVVANNGSNFFVRPFLQHNDPDPEIVGMSKFVVHTPQSVWNGSQYTFFSPFHPATQEIVPDFDDEFFDQLEGIPMISCLAQIQSPDEVDLLIANGGFANRINNIGSVFDAKRYLYRKLQENPAYLSSHPSFSSFLTTEENTNVGKFYLLEKSIDDAYKLSNMDKTALDNGKQQRNTLVELIGQPELSQEQLIENITNLLSIDEAAQVIITQYEANKSTLLNNTLTIWQSITPENIFEQYRKDVFGIYLTSQTQQGGHFTEGQINDLQEIAKQCSETGGSAVYLAQGLLPECDRAAIMTNIEKCREVPEPAPRSNMDARHILISEDAKVQISPNPAKDWINIVSVRQMEGRAEIYTLTGQLVAAKTIVFGENPVRIDLSSGVYVLRVVYENGDISSHKLVINN